MDIIDVSVIGLYVPLVVFSGIGFYLLLSRLIWPALRNRALTVDRYALGISATLSLGAHFFENIYFGVPRWTDQWDWFNNFLPAVGVWKVMIMASAIFAMAALSKATTHHTHIVRLTLLACSLWAAASLAAAFVL